MSRPAETITACEHIDRRHYALGRCRTCWRRLRRHESRERQATIERRLREYVGMAAPPAASPHGAAA